MIVLFLFFTEKKFYEQAYIDHPSTYIYPSVGLYGLNYGYSIEVIDK